MPQATDFLYVCIGISVVVVALAAAFKLVFSGRPPQRQRFVEVSDAGGEQPEEVGGLAGRLEEFRKAKFAPVVRLPTPGEPGAPRIVPPIRRSFSAPVQPQRTKPVPPPLPQDNVVIPLPLKMRKSNPPTTGED